MEELIRFGKPAETKAGHLKSEFRPLFDEKAYCEKVEQVKHYIHEGDLFQLVLSNRLEADFEGSLLDTYRVLRTTNPSPYMFYFSSDDVEIAGASPETLVKVEDGEVRTLPERGREERAMKKTSGWKKNSSPMKKSVPSTICWSIWEEMILERSVISEPWK